MTWWRLWLWNRAQAELKAVQQAQSVITETALGIWPSCSCGQLWLAG